jgi:hypothetical protein
MLYEAIQQVRLVGKISNRSRRTEVGKNGT